MISHEEFMKNSSIHELRWYSKENLNVFLKEETLELHYLIKSTWLEIFKKITKKKTPQQLKNKHRKWTKHNKSGLKSTV